MLRRLIPTLFLLLAAWVPATVARAGSIEVTVRDQDGRGLEGRYLTLGRLPAPGQADGFRHYLRGARRSPVRTGTGGKATFTELPPGTYAVDVRFDSRDASFVQPADNPFAPAPQVTLFDDQEQVELTIELWRGVRVRVALELPGESPRGFTAVFRHPGSGLERSVRFPYDRLYMERLLPPGVWEVTVAPRPGFLLVDVDRDRLSLPGHIVELDLLHEPSATFLTWTYTIPAEIEGSVVEATGKDPAIEIVATLVEPGPWHEAAVSRGGSIFKRLTASVDIKTSTFRMGVPDGRWRVQPVGSHLDTSEPEAVELDLAPGETGIANFTVRFKDSTPRGPPFNVHVENERRQSLRGVKVEIHHAGAEDSQPLRSGTTGDYGNISFRGLPKGDYRVVAGHVDYLEGRIEVPDHDPGQPESQRTHNVVLPDGAEIRLQAFDPAGEPLAGVELTAQRIDELPNVILGAQEFLDAKLERSTVSDQSGRGSVGGFYGGVHRLSARLRGADGSRGLIYLTTGEEDPRRELELELTAGEPIEVEARMLPAASLTATLVCSDAWDMPDTVAVRVFEAHEFDPAVNLFDLPASFATEALVLEGRSRDHLEVGPFQRGVYYLALQPEGFDRWTWAFEAHAAPDAARLQVGTSPEEMLGKVDLGMFQVECGPAVDLLPAVASGDAFPDLREVTTEARFFDLDRKKQVARRLSIVRRQDRILLRGAPGGRLRLDLTLTHPHLLPEPSLSWQIEMELERGRFVEIAPEVEALGGAILIAGGTAAKAGLPLYALLKGPDDIVVRRTAFEDGEAEVPSIVPGRYRLEVIAEGDEPIRVWKDLEVQAGETSHLSLGATTPSP